MTLNCFVTIGFPLDFPFRSFSCLAISHDVLVVFLPFLSTPPSCPCHCLSMSASFSMYVPSFRCQSFAYISCRVDWFPCPLFPFDSPCTPLVFISVPFMSLSVPLCFPFISPCFPVMSTSYFLPSFPCTSLHFPFAPQYSHKKTRFFPAFSQKGCQQTQSFSRCSAKGGRKPKPAKSQQEDSSLGSLFCDTGSPKTALSGTSSNYHAVRALRQVNPTCQTLGGGGVGGGSHPVSSLKCLRNVGGHTHIDTHAQTQTHKQTHTHTTYIYIYIRVCTRKGTRTYI